VSSNKIFDLYVDFLISNVGQATATRLSELTDFFISHDKITRALSEPEYGPQDLWKKVKPLVRKVENECGVVSFDDSILEKEYSDENDLICWHYDHTKGRNIKGINLVSSLYYQDNISIPISFHLVKKTERYLDKKGNEQRRSPITKNEMIRDMSEKIISNNIKLKYFLTDSWFSASENMVHFKSVLKKDFIMAAKSNRTVALSIEDKKNKKYISLESVNLEENSTKEIYLEGVKFPLLVCKKIFINKDGSKGTLYLITSDTLLSYDDIIQVYQKRWKIEEYHKSLKQNTSITKSPTHVVRTQSNHIFASLCAYLKLEKMKIVKKLNHFSLMKLISLNAQKSILQDLKDMSDALNMKFSAA